MTSCSINLFSSYNESIVFACPDLDFVMKINVAFVNTDFRSVSEFLLEYPQ